MTASMLMVFPVMLNMLAAVEAAAVAEAANRWTLPTATSAGRRADGGCDTEEGMMQMGQSLYLDECRKLVCKSIVGRPIIEEHFCETLPEDLPPSCVVQDGRGTRHPACCARVVCSPDDETYEFETTKPSPGNPKPYPRNPKPPQRIPESLPLDNEYLSGIPRDPLPPQLTNPSIPRIPETLTHAPVYARDPVFPGGKVPSRYIPRRPHGGSRAVGKYSVPARRPVLSLRRPVYLPPTPRPLRVSTDFILGHGYSYPWKDPASPVNTRDPFPAIHIRPPRLPSRRPLPPPEIHSWKDEVLVIPLDPPNNNIHPHDFTGGSLHYDDDNEAFSRHKLEDSGGEPFLDVRDAFPDYKNEVNYKDERPWKVSELHSYKDEANYRGETSWEVSEVFPQHEDETDYGEELSLVFPLPPTRLPSPSSSSQPLEEVSYVYYTDPRDVRTSPHPYQIYPITTPLPEEAGGGAGKEDVIFPTNSVFPEREEEDTEWRPVFGVTTTPSQITTTTTTTTPRPSLRRPGFPRTRRPFTKTPRPRPFPLPSGTTRLPHVTTWRPSIRHPIITTTPSTLTTTPDLSRTTLDTPTSTPASYEFATAKLNPNKHDIHEFFHTPLDPSELIPGHDAFMKSKQEAQKEYQNSNAHSTPANKTRRSLSPATSSQGSSGVKRRPVFHIPWRKTVNMVSQPSSTPLPEQEMDEVSKAKTFHPIKFDADFERPKMTTEQFIVDLPPSLPSSESLAAGFSPLKPERKLKSFRPLKSKTEEGRHFLEESLDDNTYENTPTDVPFLLREENKVKATEAPILALTLATMPPSPTLGPQGRTIDEDDDVETLGIKIINHYPHPSHKQESNSAVDITTNAPSTPPALTWSPPPFRFPGRRRYGVPRPRPDHLQIPDYGTFPEKDYLGALLYEPIKQGTKPTTPPLATPSRADEAIPGTPMDFDTLDSFHNKTESRLTEVVAHKTHTRMQTGETDKDTNPQESSREGVPLQAFSDNYRPSDSHGDTPSSFSSSRQEDSRMSEVYYYADEGLYDEKVDFEDSQYFDYILDEAKTASTVPKQLHSFTAPEGVLEQEAPQPPQLQMEEVKESGLPRWKTSSEMPTVREALKPDKYFSEENERQDVPHGLTKDLHPYPLHPMAYDKNVEGEFKPPYHHSPPDSPTTFTEGKMRSHNYSQWKEEKEEMTEEEEEEEDEDEENRRYSLRNRLHRPQVITSRASFTTPLPHHPSSITTTATTEDESFFNNTTTTLPTNSNNSSFNQTHTLPQHHNTSAPRTLRRRPESRPVSNTRLRDTSRRAALRKPQESRPSSTLSRSRDRLLPQANKQMRLPPPNQRRLSPRPASYRLRTSRLATGTHKESAEGTKKISKPSESLHETQDPPHNPATSVEIAPMTHIPKDPKPHTRKPAGSTQSSNVTLNPAHPETTPRATQTPMGPHHEDTRGPFTHEPSSVPHQSPSLRSQGQTMISQDRSTDKQTYSYRRARHESSIATEDDWEPLREKRATEM